MSSPKIERLWAREVLDSRGNPTVEAEIATADFTVSAIAPSGASTGSHEALELRDGGKRYGGKGVQKAVDNIRRIIAPELRGRDIRDQKGLDQALISLDGTENKSRLGANATTAVSLACAKGGALAEGIALYEHLARGSHILPVPMMNIINGGRHAGSNLRIQEFMIVPAGAPSFAEAIRMGAEIYQVLKKLLKERYGPSAINIGDEGGFAPAFETTAEALEALMKAIDSAGYSPGEEVFLALDSAASEFFEDGFYQIDGKRLGSEEIIDFYISLTERYPIISLEDPLHEEAFESMAEMTKRVGDKVQIVGDDIFVTNVERVRKAIQMKAGNAMLLKVNQIGTVTEAFAAAHLCLSSGYNVVVSHRSGESEDTSIADIAVALGCGQIKTGAPARTERTAKYNRLMRIEEALGSKAQYPGVKAFGRK